MDTPKPTSSLRANLEYRCRDCDWCRGNGLVTVFHELYDGHPYVTLRRHHDGQPRKYALRVAVPCCCLLGQWIRETHEQEATSVRQLSLADVIEGRIPWTLFDPTEPPPAKDEPTTWAELNRRIAAPGYTGAVKVVRPQYAGNRETARREMGVDQHREEFADHAA